jgi:hypothetical protein
MASPPATISHVIDTLARQTRAPEDFVLRTREMFVRRGISLDEPSAPYFDTLLESFEREERVRLNAEQARQRLRELDGHLVACERGCREIVSDLERIQRNLRQQARRLGLD